MKMRTRPGAALAIRVGVALVLLAGATGCGGRGRGPAEAATGSADAAAGPPGEAEVLENLRAPDDAKTFQDLRALVKQHPAAVTAVCVRELDDPDGRLACRASMGLALVPDISALAPTLISHMLHSSVPGVRAGCAGDVGMIPTSAAHRALIEALKDSYGPVVCGAAPRLAVEGEQDAVGPLRAALHHPSAHARFEVCMALINLHGANTETVRTLQDLRRYPWCARRLKEWVAGGLPDLVAEAEKQARQAPNRKN